MGKGDTEVRVEQTAVQNQETNINASKDLNRIIDNLTGVLLSDSQNQPTSLVVPVNIIGDPQGQSPDAQKSQFNNGELFNLLALMNFNSARGQQQIKDPDQLTNLTTILIAAAVVIIAVFVSRR